MNARVLLSVAGGIFLFLLLHLLIWRLRPSNSPRIFWLAGLGGMGILISEFIHFSLAGFQGAESCIILGLGLSIVIFYLILYGVIVRSVSVTLLTRLLGCRAPLDFEVLLEEYRLSSRFEERVQVMHQSGLVTLSMGSVTLTPKGRWLVRVAEALARVFSDRMEG